MKDITDSMRDIYDHIEETKVPIDYIIKTDKKGLRKILAPERLPFCFLTRKAHKTPVSERMVTSVASFALRSLAR